MQRLRALCDQHGILLICDEVQTGAGRTGTWFACEQSGIAPDLITLAKSMAGGFPISAVVGRAEVMDAPAAGGLGGTYAGSPMACAAALAVLDEFEKHNLLQRSRDVARESPPAFDAARNTTASPTCAAWAPWSWSCAERDVHQPVPPAKALAAEATKRGLTIGPVSAATWCASWCRDRERRRAR
jgi:4-aminobutyrate aminotransferase/(S)-3-amino-2-methylpropionate transaminase